MIEMNKNNYKKGQADIFGLVFIVLIVLVAIIFFIGTNLNKKSNDIKNSFDNDVLSLNTITNIMKTTAKDCNKLSLGDLFIDCAKNKNDKSKLIVCNDGEATIENSNSCDYAKYTTQIILENSLSSWGKVYQMKVSLDDNTEIFSYGSFNEKNQCDLLDRNVKTSLLPLNPGFLKVELMMCNE
jgi:hypothetical protein